MNPFVYVLACIGMLTVATFLFVAVACLVIDRLDVEPATAPTMGPEAAPIEDTGPSVADEAEEWLLAHDRFTDWEELGWWE